MPGQCQCMRQRAGHRAYCQHAIFSCPDSASSPDEGCAGSLNRTTGVWSASGAAAPKPANGVCTTCNLALSAASYGPSPAIQGHRSQILRGPSARNTCPQPPTLRTVTAHERRLPGVRHDRRDPPPLQQTSALRGTREKVPFIGAKFVQHDHLDSSLAGEHQIQVPVSFTRQTYVPAAAGGGTRLRPRNVCDGHPLRIYRSEPPKDVGGGDPI